MGDLSDLDFRATLLDELVQLPGLQRQLKLLLLKSGFKDGQPRTLSGDLAVDLFYALDPSEPPSDPSVRIRFLKQVKAHAGRHPVPLLDQAITYTPQPGPAPTDPRSSGSGNALPLPKGFTHHAFLSHASVDKARVRDLQIRLEEAHFKVWVDDTCVGWGESIQRAIEQGLKGSRHIILFLTKASAERDWVQLETLMTFMLDPANRTRRLLTLVMDDVEIPLSLKPFRFLYYRNRGERDVAWWWIQSTLKGESTPGHLLDIQGPTVLSNDSRRDLIGRYRALLHQRHARFKVLGIDRNLNLSFMQQQTWVSLRASVQSQVMVREHFGNSADVDEFIRQEGRGRTDYLLEEAFSVAAEKYGQRRHIVVVGDPGSGKTTLLRQMLVMCLERGSDALGLPPDLLPVHLPLRELTETDQSIDTFIKTQLNTNPHLKPLGPVGEKLLERGELLLLLDGLDEVADPTRRAQVVEWVRGAAEGIGWHVAVTTRYAGWRSGTLGDGFVEFHILPFDTTQAEQFIKNWFLGVLEAEQGQSEPTTREATRRAADLWEQLASFRVGARRLKSLTTNPLLLSILCLIRYDQGVLPNKRHLLYQKASEVLLRDWRAAQGLRGFEPEQAQARLEPLALELTREGQTLVSEADLVKCLTAHQAPGLDIITEEEAKNFAQAIRDESGLLVGWSQERYGFLHKTFQEFHAALRMVNSGNTVELADHLGERRILKDGKREDEGWWDEVTLLSLALCERPAFETFMTRVIESGRVRADQKLLGECIEEAKAPSPAPLLAALGDEAKVGWEDRHEVLNLLGTWFRREATGHELVRAIAEGRAPWLRNLAPEHAQVVRTTAMGLAGEAKVVVVAERKVGDVYIHLPGVLDLEMVWVPPGTFVMGSDDGDDDEKPIHKVTLTQGYWLSRTPITNAHYRKFVEVTGHPPSEEDGNSQFNAPDQPVVGVSWEDSQTFCKWAGLKLPTEAQWEWAARGPEGRKYPWGDEDPTPKLANYWGGPGRTTPVGSHPLGASWVGALDMAGNVWEWCQDWYNAYRPGEQVDPTGPDGPLSNRVVRGGSWNGDASWLRGSSRGSRDPTGRDYLFGFRVVVPSSPGHE